jgi:hypothetical protein
VCKYTFNHYPIIPIHLLYEKVTLYSRYFDGHRISFNWLVVVRSAEFLKRTLAKRFANVFLLCRLRDISNKAGGHLKNSELLVFGTCCMAFLWAGRPSYRLQFPAMSFSTTAMSVKNMPCLVRISTVAMSAKMPHLKYALSHPGSSYATKRGHTSIATQPESFLLSVNSRRPTDHRAKSRSALMPRQTLGRSLVTGSKQSADPLVSPRSKQFPF